MILNYFTDVSPKRLAGGVIIAFYIRSRHYSDGTGGALYWQCPVSLLLREAL
jgi:hypothetical protein